MTKKQRLPRKLKKKLFGTKDNRINYHSYLMTYGKKSPIDQLIKFNGFYNTLLTKIELEIHKTSYENN